jgi:hypothetical protein
MNVKHIKCLLQRWIKHESVWQIFYFFAGQILDNFEFQIKK